MVKTKPMICIFRSSHKESCSRDINQLKVICFLKQEGKWAGCMGCIKVLAAMTVYKIKQKYY